MICKEAENSIWSHFWVTVQGLVSWCSSIEDILLLGGRLLLVKCKQFWQKKSSHQGPNATNPLTLAGGPCGQPYFSVLGVPLHCLTTASLSSPSGIPGNSLDPCRQAVLGCGAWRFFPKALDNPSSQ